MKAVRRGLEVVFGWISVWLKCSLTSLWRALSAADIWIVWPGTRGPCKSELEEWKTNEALRHYHRPADESSVTVQTRTHIFHVDLFRLSECSEYFRALSQSGMRETSESLVQLDHVSSSVFYHFLEFSFHNRFIVPVKELDAHIQLSSYLLAETFLSECLSVLEGELSPDNCCSYLSLAQEICCEQLKRTVFAYMSRNMLEMPHLVTYANPLGLSGEEKDEIVRLRMEGRQHLCSLRKENLTSWNDSETESARHVFTLEGSEESGSWHPVTELPFRADKWCFTTVVLYNYLYIIGGYRQRVRRGWEFKMASFRFNPFTGTWACTAPLMKHRRHFSAVACEGCIYAVGGWYLDSLITPDSNTTLYTAVERYDPWEGRWRFVSSLPLTDFQFTMSLSHDIPLTTSHGHCLYVLGSIQRTGEKLLLQYNTKHDSWSELLPTLTRADADLPALYFLGATDRLIVIGGNNSESVVTSFCVQSRRWEQVRTAEKVAFAGQGTLAGDQALLMPSIQHNTIIRMDLQTLSTRDLPPLPIATRYEAIFYLCF
ncbi:hypothetical protein D4764_13G0011060 [Takifugu flavidus]|uniref:BTB domain-containing protein n=1 Tax=Takifugu flavidus TaxID=433684 RepID=A0A5C6P9H7_9TELE|nr:hypothetical protein D4764_13G0011060 [Takifugu flavidus]